MQSQPHDGAQQHNTPALPYEAQLLEYTVSRQPLFASTTLECLDRIISLLTQTSTALKTVSEAALAHEAQDADKSAGDAASLARKNAFNTSPYVLQKVHDVQVDFSAIMRLASAITTATRSSTAELVDHGKRMEQSLASDYRFACEAVTTKRESDDQCLISILCSHLARDGHRELAFDISEKFGAQSPRIDSSPLFQQMQSITEDLAAGNFDECLTWIAKHREEIAENDESFEFDINKIRYMRLLMNVPREQSPGWSTREHRPESADRGNASNVGYESSAAALLNPALVRSDSEDNSVYEYTPPSRTQPLLTALEFAQSSFRGHEKRIRDIQRLLCGLLVTGSTWYHDANLRDAINHNVNLNQEQIATVKTTQAKQSPHKDAQGLVDAETCETRKRTRNNSDAVASLSGEFASRGNVSRIFKGNSSSVFPIRNLWRRYMQTTLGPAAGAECTSFAYQESVSHSNIEPKFERKGDRSDIAAAAAAEAACASNHEADARGIVTFTPRSIIERFVRMFCRVHRLSPKSPLELAFTTGLAGLPSIVGGQRLFQSRVRWDEQTELHVDMPILPENRYHSVFVCPVSREQSIAGNCPVLLPCGHCIACNSMSKLLRTGNSGLRCPYCPRESTVSQTIELRL